MRGPKPDQAATGFVRHGHGPDHHKALVDPRRRILEPAGVILGLQPVDVDGPGGTVAAQWLALEAAWKRQRAQ